MDGNEFRNLLGRFATGVTVVTTKVGDRLHGMTANAFSSVSLDPPLVLVCVAHTANCHQQIRDAGAFGVNILGEDQEEVSNQFARKSEPDEALADCPFRLSDREIPLLDGCIAHLECELEHSYDGGDHTIFVGRVLAGAESEGDGAPLLFYRGAYSRLSST